MNKEQNEYYPLSVTVGVKPSVIISFNIVIILGEQNTKKAEWPTVRFRTAFIMAIDNCEPPTGSPVCLVNWKKNGMP